MKSVCHCHCPVICFEAVAFPSGKRCPLRKEFHNFVKHQIGLLIAAPVQSSSEFYLHALLPAGTTAPQDSNRIHTEDIGKSIFCL